MATHGAKMMTERLAMNQTKAAEALGITDRTLRNWERRKLITGYRAANGVKLYPFEDLQKLLGK